MVYVCVCVLFWFRTRTIITESETFRFRTGTIINQTKKLKRKPQSAKQLYIVTDLKEEERSREGSAEHLYLTSRRQFTSPHNWKERQRLPKGMQELHYN